MISFRNDQDIEPLQPGKNQEDLCTLLSLLCGQRVTSPSEAEFAISELIVRVRKHGDANVKLSYEEFNELLLLFGQLRVERPFFDFFFLDKDPRQEQLPPNNAASIAFAQLKECIKRFRGFAMLCFGNFRFAFQRLRSERDAFKFMELLDPWNRDSRTEMEKFRRRQEPLTPLTGTSDELKGDKTWFLGYLSSDRLKADFDAIEKRKELAKGAAKRGNLRAVDKDLKELDGLIRELNQLVVFEQEAKEKGKRNTTKYLTWDYLDVYVATSMRNPWEFRDTYNFAKKVFDKKLLGVPNVRWFDPTQSYSEQLTDKGLLEGLMLKRAKCTIYMAQEGDTLGKDSELAATLAQGKPVVAYVPAIIGTDLTKFRDELKKRPIEYFRQRLLTLLADGFFHKADNRRDVIKRASNLGLKVDPDALVEEINKLFMLLFPFERKRQYQVVGTEERDFRKTHKAKLERAATLLAAIESRAADNRADIIKHRHPLALQVHLETGVANGVLLNIT